MSTAKLAKRRAGIGPIFVGSYRSGDTIEPWDPRPGNIATLRINEVEVIVRIAAASGRKYSGRIVGFENLDVYEYEGFAVDSEVEFTFDNVMSVMS